jgi:hypothetical protein
MKAPTDFSSGSVEPRRSSPSREGLQSAHLAHSRAPRARVSFPIASPALGRCVGNASSCPEGDLYLGPGIYRRKRVSSHSIKRQVRLSWMEMRRPGFTRM